MEETQDRPLHGCLLAYAGRGCALLNGADNNAELRFSLAHEAAHFMLDYLSPRQEATSRLGPEILEVFDGRRAATTQERVHAILGQISVGFHTHFMDRGNDGVMGCVGTGEVEASADHLAFELLAPEDEVRRRVGRVARNYDQHHRLQTATRILREQFGLPPSIAVKYTRLLYPDTRSSSVRDWLRQRS